MHRNRTWQIDPTELRTQRNRILPIEGGDGSTLNLDFTTGILDPRLTFSRASTATFVNSSGYVEYAGANLVLYSQQITTTNWSTGNATTLAPNTTEVLDPQGGNTATKISLGANAYNSRAQAIALPGSQTYTFSFWIRGTAGITCRIYSFAGYVGDLVTETVYSYSTSEWTRVSTTFTTNAATTNVLVYVCSKNTAPASTDVIYVWGAQLNPGTTAQTYYPTTTAAFYSTPRFDYSPTNIGEPRGLLIEGQATNLSNSVELWGATLTTISLVTGQLTPANDSAVYKVTDNATNGQHSINRTPIIGTALLGNVYTASVWMKKPSTNAHSYAGFQIAFSAGGGVVTTFNLATGANTQSFAYGGAATPTYTSTAYSNGWFRYTMTFTFPGNGSANIYILLSNDGTTTSYAGTGTDFYVWGAQVEAGSGASSYIPTGASQVTRNQDDCYISGTNFSSWYKPTEGSLFIQWTGGSGLNTGDGRSYTLLNATQTNQIFEGSNYGLNVYLSAFQAQIGNNLGTMTSAAKVASAFKQADFATSVNGSNAAVQSSGTMPTLVDRLSIGSNYLNAASFKFACIKQIKYYPVRLSNAQLKSLSTP